MLPQLGRVLWLGLRVGTKVNRSVSANGDEDRSGLVTTLIYGVLTVLGIVVLVFTAVRVFVGGLEDSPAPASRPAGSVQGSARQILDRRYAEGELSTEDYQHRLRVLQGEKT